MFTFTWASPLKATRISYRPAGAHGILYTEMLLRKYLDKFTWKESGQMEKNCYDFSFFLENISYEFEFFLQTTNKCPILKLPDSLKNSCGIIKPTWSVCMETDNGAVWSTLTENLKRSHSFIGAIEIDPIKIVDKLLEFEMDSVCFE